MKFTIYDLRFTTLKILLSATLLTFSPSVHAEITASVTPGYQFSTGERPTTSTLNALGTPTIAITGTLGGTNVALGAATVSGTMLMDSVAGSNLTWNGSSPRGLVIANSGVGTNQISVDIAGLGLGGGGGFPLSNKVDNVRITIVSDVATFNAQTNTIVGGSGTNYVVHVGNGLVMTNGDLYVNIGAGLQFSSGAIALSNTPFASSEFVLGVGSVGDTAHGFSAAPSVVRWVLVCKTANAGYVVGDEVNVDNFFDTSMAPAFAAGGNGTNVFLFQTISSPHVINRSTGSDVSINSGSWRAKAYAHAR